jgi:hypothetical protein
MDENKEDQKDTKISEVDNNAIVTLLTIAVGILFLLLFF